MTTVKYKCTAYTTEVRWRIENFSTVATRDDPKTSCLVKILHSSKAPIILYLMPQNLDGEESVKLSWHFWTENVDGKQIGDQRRIEYTFLLSESTPGYGIPDFVNHEELYPPSEFVKNDIVFICLDIKRSIEQPDFKPIELDTSFCDNMWLFYQQGDAADECTIQIGTKNFKIKKQLLTNLSDTFMQMFNSGLEESRTNVVKIEDVKPEVFKSFIQYIYKGYLNSTSIEYVEDLFMFADKYLIEKLKSECSLIMRKSITKDNVLSLFILASTHNDKEFKDHLLGYIMNENDDNNWRSILKSKELLKLKLSNEQLADEISDLIFDKIAGAMSKTS